MIILVTDPIMLMKVFLPVCMLIRITKAIISIQNSHSSPEVFSSDNSSDDSQILVLTPCVNEHSVTLLTLKMLFGRRSLRKPTCTSTNQLCAFIRQILLLLYWRNRLLKNRVGWSGFFFFFNPAVCPFIHTYPVYIFIKT